MTQTSVNTITPIKRDELVRLSEKGKANPGAVRTLKVKTVLESKFRHLNLNSCNSSKINAPSQWPLVTSSPSGRGR
jgi:hypothetical protein